MRFQSGIDYQNGGVSAAAVYCSDGRFSAQCEDFLFHGLGIEHCDLIVIPGGPARLAGYAEPSFDEHAILDELTFLVQAHGLTRVILIQHEDCGHYQHKLGVSRDDLRPLQDTDAMAAAQAVRDATGLKRIECYCAVVVDGKVHFEPIDMDHGAGDSGGVDAVDEPGA